MTRRQLLRTTRNGLGAGAVGIVVAGTLTSCSFGSSQPDVDPLLALSTDAHRDARNARALAAQAADRANALTQVAAERAAHAAALDQEIARAAGATTTPPTPTPATPAPTPQLTQLRSDLGQSQRNAAQVAQSVNGHRAGLVASVSAACAAEVQVLLA